VRCVGGDDSGGAGFGAFFLAVDREIQLTFDDRLDFFLFVEVLVDGGALLKFVVREGYAGRMEVASEAAGFALDDF